MLRKSSQSSAQEPSFFYLMMAESCSSATGARHPNASGALREIGRRYLAGAKTWHRRWSRSRALPRIEAKPRPPLPLAAQINQAPHPEKL